LGEQTFASPIIVPARSGKAFRVHTGDSIAVIDLEGGQVGDLFAFVADNPAEYLSASHTRASRQRMFPAVGEAFVTNRRRPVLTLVEDTSPGVHDMLIAACDPERYDLLGSPDHASCQDNLGRALHDEGIVMTTVPQPVNLFMNIPWDERGQLAFATSPSRPGDQVVLRAELDVIVVVSACPQDIVPINRREPAHLGVAVLPARASTAG
jgi:uncharacterized protein